MQSIYLVVFCAIFLSACAINTKSVSFNEEAAKTLPEEVAIDTLVSYSKSIRGEESSSNCDFTVNGAAQRERNEVTPYDNTCFYTKNKAYTPIDFHSHIYIVNKISGLVICDSLISLHLHGQKNFERRMKWLGTALLSLGSDYCPELK